MRVFKTRSFSASLLLIVNERVTFQEEQRRTNKNKTNNMDSSFDSIEARGGENSIEARGGRNTRV